MIPVMAKRLALLTLSLAIAASAQQARAPRAISVEQFRANLPADVEWTPDIAYREGNEAWKLDLAVPKASSSAPRPGMVIVHGGGWRGGDKRVGQWGRLPIDFAQQGYVAISVNYRLQPDFTIRNCVEDVKNAVRWLRANAKEYNLDSDRIGAYGNSAGAHLVAILGLTGNDAGLEGDGPFQEQSSQVNAVLASATPTDFPNFGKDSGRAERGTLGGDDPQDRLKLSPITYLRKDAPPFLLVHGTADRTVPLVQSERFVKALREAGAKEVRLMIFDGDGHGVFEQQRLLTYPAMRAFFEHALSTK
jgi:acetyl esterase/lipase